MLKILSETDFFPFLEASFREVNTDDGITNAKIKDESYALIDSKMNFDYILSHVVCDEQIDYALEQSTLAHQSHFLDQNLSIKLLNKSNAIAGYEVTEPIIVEIFIEILGIDIPDNSKDEVELELFIHTYTQKEPMFSFLVDKELCSEVESKRLLVQWNTKSYYYPRTETEIEFIDKILDVELESYYEKKIKEVQYNLQFDESRLISRSKRVVYKIKNSLNNRRFPFDVSTILLEFALSSNFDISEVKLVPEISSTVKKTTPFIYDTYKLRGFNVVSSQSKPVCVGYYQSADYYLQNLSLINLSLKRDSNAFIIRTFIPACIIQLIATFAAFIYFYDNSLRDSIVMSVIPSILLAEIIQHSTVNSHVPTRSGKTLIDMFFVRVYLSLMCFFIGLTLTKNIVLSSIFLSIGALIVLFNFIKIGIDIYQHYKNSIMDE